MRPTTIKFIVKFIIFNIIIIMYTYVYVLNRVTDHDFPFGFNELPVISNQQSIIPYTSKIGLSNTYHNHNIMQ